MAAQGVYEWKVYCEGESKFINCYSKNVPLSCPNNNTHVIDNKQTALIPDSSSPTVQIQIEDAAKRTQGRYQSRTIRMDIPGTGDIKDFGNITIVDFELPFPITLMAVQFHCRPDNIGDVLSCVLDRNRTIGSLTSDCKLGDTKIYIPAANIASTATTVNNVAASTIDGLGVQYYDADTKTTIDLGTIKSTDLATGALTLDKPLTQDLSSGKFIQINRYMVKDYYLHSDSIQSLGYSKLGGSYIPTGIKGSIVYKNNSYIPKSFSLMIEFYY
jgi:hypothetical protein